MTDERRGLVTDPLPISQPCGCPYGEGHYCPVPWIDDWPTTKETT